jgi:hypothetical protein
VYECCLLRRKLHVIWSLHTSCHVRGVCVTNKNGVWIRWLDLLPSSLKLQSITTAHNQDSLHSLLDYECLLFCVTDLVLIYESVTSSAFVARWLTLHSWTLDDSYERINHEWTFFYNSGRTEERPPPRTLRPLLSFSSVATKRVLISGQRFWRAVV